MLNMKLCYLWVRVQYGAYRKVLTARRLVTSPMTSRNYDVILVTDIRFYRPTELYAINIRCLNHVSCVKTCSFRKILPEMSNEINPNRENAM